MSEWISVEERLPETYEDVLLWNDEVDVGYLTSAEGERWWLYSDREPDFVTHWMPLPDGPKEKQ